MVMGLCVALLISVCELPGAPQVYPAPAPIVALRVLQDPNASVDCVICAHKTGPITSLEFLQTLRPGRWGVDKIRDVKFTLSMKRLDVSSAQVADASCACA